MFACLQNLAALKERILAENRLASSLNGRVGEHWLADKINPHYRNSVHRQRKHKHLEQHMGRHAGRRALRGKLCLLFSLYGHLHVTT